jgi:hypothetical protein
MSVRFVRTPPVIRVWWVGFERVGAEIKRAYGSVDFPLWVILRLNRTVCRCASIGLVLLHELTFCTLRPASKVGVLPERSFWTMSFADRGHAASIRTTILPAIARPSALRTGDPHDCRGAIFATPHCNCGARASRADKT